MLSVFSSAMGRNSPRISTAWETVRRSSLERDGSLLSAKQDCWRIHAAQCPLVIAPYCAVPLMLMMLVCHKGFRLTQSHAARLG